MGDSKRETPREEPLRHKHEGHGTHGEPQEKELQPKEPRRDLPEGNGATGEPAAFPKGP